VAAPENFGRQPEDIFVCYRQSLRWPQSGVTLVGALSSAAPSWLALTMLLPWKRHLRRRHPRVGVGHLRTISWPFSASGKFYNQVWTHKPDWFLPLAGPPWVAALAML